MKRVRVVCCNTIGRPLPLQESDQSDVDCGGTRNRQRHTHRVGKTHDF